MANPQKPTWTAPRRIYLDKNGAVIPDGGNADPVTLLVNAGAKIPLNLAVALGLATVGGTGVLVALFPKSNVSATATVAHSSLTLSADASGSASVSVGGGAPVVLLPGVPTVVAVPSGASAFFDCGLLDSSGLVTGN